jgi:eukaryotic-like serine/threonine-protein kinase
MSMQNETQPPTVGTGRRFRIQHCLGAGGFGEVYLATMLSTGGVRSDVALKVLHQGLDAHSQAVQRLQDEAKMLGVLNHPSILQIHDLVLLENRVALVTEYIPGADLDVAMFGADPMPLRVVLETLARVADALHAAFHTTSPTGAPLGLVHRDVKPSNIRVGRHGEVKLLDFGIAKAANVQREAKTHTNTVIGSFFYMAPERFEDKPDTPAGDVYALGCCLYEAIARERLFHEIPVKKQYLYALNREKHDAFVAERMADASAPDAVVALLGAMLIYEPTDRPTAGELGALLEDVAESLEGPTLRKWARNHAWPNAAPTQGALDGRDLSESAVTTLGFRQKIREVARSSSGQRQTVQPNAAETLFASLEPEPSRTGRNTTLAILGGLAVLLLILAGMGTLGGLGILAYELTGSTEAPVERKLDNEVAQPEPRPEPASEPVPEPQPVTPEPVPEPSAPTAAPSPHPGSGTAEPTPEPRPTQPASTPSNGHVSFDGQASSITLVSGTNRYPPGDVPPGRYKVYATFEGVGEVEAGSVTVHRDQPLVLHCRAGFYRCEP